MKKHCSVCNAEFDCGTSEPTIRCWCESLPAIMPLSFEQDCQCPSCLPRTIGKRIQELIDNLETDRLVSIAAPYRSRSELVEHIDYTIEDGKYVFSKWFHLKRGTCCGNACRNCPYQHENVKPL